MAKKKGYMTAGYKMVKKKAIPGNTNTPKEDAATAAAAGQKRKFNDKNKKKTYMGRCKKLLSNMMELDDSKPFRTAVDKLKYPDYHAEVRYDIDLTRIATKLSIGQYADPIDFGRDIRLMVNNWKYYIKDRSLPIYSQITRLSWWFESEYSKIVVAFEDHKNKRRRIEEDAVSRPAVPPPALMSAAIPTPPHLMSTVAENGILRIRRAPGAATTPPEGRNTSQANANVNDLRNQIRNNQRPNLNTNPRPSTSAQGNTTTNHNSAPTGAPTAGGPSRADRAASAAVTAVINATRVAVSRTASVLANNRIEAHVSGQHNANTATNVSPSVAPRPAAVPITSRLGPRLAPPLVASRPLSSPVTSRLGPAPASSRLATTPATGRLGASITSRLSFLSTHLPTIPAAAPRSPRLNITAPGNNTTGNNATRPARTPTAPPRISPTAQQSSGANTSGGAKTPSGGTNTPSGGTNTSGGANAPSGGPNTPSGGAAVSTPGAVAEQQQPELELLFGASHVWFGECKSKPPRDIRITEQGIEFPIKSANYEAVISVNSNDIVRCCGHFGNLGKLQNTLFLFLTPSATKHVRASLEDNGMTGDVVSLIVIFSQNMTTEKISRLIHIFWRIGRQSIFGPLFSEVDKKGALNIIANIKPQILQRLSQNMNSSSPASSEMKSPAVRSPSVPHTARSAVPNLAAAQIRRNSSTEAANPSSTTSDRSQSDRDTPSGIQNTNGAANAGAIESEPKDSNSNASHGYTFQRSRLQKIDSRNREPQAVMQVGRHLGMAMGQKPPFPLFRNMDKPSRPYNRNPNHNFVEPQLRNRATDASRNFDYPMCNDNSFEEPNRPFNMQNGRPNFSQSYQGFPTPQDEMREYVRHLEQPRHMPTENWGHGDLYGQPSDMHQDRPRGYDGNRRDQQLQGYLLSQNSDMIQDQPVGYEATENISSRNENAHNQNSGTIQDQPVGLNSAENQESHAGSGESNDTEVDDPLRSVQVSNRSESDLRRIRIRISQQTTDENQNQASNDLEMSPAEATPPVEDVGACSAENLNNVVLDSNVSSTVQTCNTDTEVETSDLPPSEDGRTDMDTELVSSSAPSLVADVGAAVPLDSDAHLADQQQNPALDLRPESEANEAHEISDDDDDDLEIIIPSDIDDDLAFVPASVRQTKDEDGEDLVMMASRISTKCPVTQQVMRRPVKNRHCGHCYDRDGIQQLIINRTTKARCPVPGCSNPNVLMMGDMEFDNKLFDYIHTHNPDPELQKELDKVAEELDNQPLRTRRPRAARPMMLLDIYTTQELNGTDSE